MVCTLVSIHFDSPQLGHTRKTNSIKIQTVHPETCSILKKKFRKKGPGTKFPPHFVYDF